MSLKKSKKAVKNNVSNSLFALEDVVPLGFGKKVKITYYNIETGEKFVKEEDNAWNYITASREVNYKKYDFNTIEEYVEAEVVPFFSGKVSGCFVSRPYGSRRENNEYSDSDFYRRGEETGIVWHLGSRRDYKDLEFFINNDVEKPLFVRNGAKRFRARTKIVDKENLEVAEEYVVNFLKTLDLEKSGLKNFVFDRDDVHVKNDFVEFVCKRPMLKYLDKRVFRINVYDSVDFKKEVEAERFLEELKKIRGFKIHVDQAKVIKRRRGVFDINYGVRLVCDEHRDFVKDLDEVGLSRVFDSSSNRPLFQAREIRGDPLELHSATSQLRFFFPSHILYDPSKSLREQASVKVPVFSHFRSRGVSELESAVDRALKFYSRNSVSVDLETTEYVKGSKKLTGRVFMAVLRSDSESKIYMTRDTWKTEKKKRFFVENISGAELVFVDDEVDLIGSLYADCRKYEYIFGHNFREFDQKHLIKYNGENDLFRINKITLKQKEKIKRWKTLNDSSNLWGFSENNVLDTYNYIRNRVSVLEDNTLGTFAGVEKPLSHDELEFLKRRGTKKDILKILDYTIGDGIKTEELRHMLLKTAVLESFAFFKGFGSVFSSNPVKNFYDAGARDYFMKMNTHKSRHEFSPVHYLEKLEARERPSELIHGLVRDKKQKVGVVDGYLVFPGAAINACSSMINKNPVTKFMLDEAKQSCNVLEKIIYFQNVHASVQVALDKVKNFIKSRDLSFGEQYSAFDVFRTLSEADLVRKKKGLRRGDIDLGDDFIYDDDVSVFDSSLEDDLESEYFREYKKKDSDFDTARTNYITCVEYGFPRSVIRIGSIVYDFGLLNVNNVFSAQVGELREGLLARTKGLYVSSSPGSDFVLGEIRGINFRYDGFVGRIGSYDLFLNKRRPSNKLVRGMLDFFLEGNSQVDVFNKFRDDIFRIHSSLSPSDKEYVGLLSGFKKPVRTKKKYVGNLSLEL